MFIQPDSIIRLIKKCPLDSDYRHTVYFANEGVQSTYFKSMDSVVFPKQSYQRYDLGVISLQATADSVYSCNYLMFQNTAFGNKWFYAFINKIDYVNNVTCRVHYEIDIMQTWYLSCTHTPCFVEREHSKDDIIGENLQPENVDLGTFIYGTKLSSPKDGDTTMDAMAVIVLYNPAVVDLPKLIIDEDFLLDRGIYSGNYQGVPCVVIPVPDTPIENLNQIFEAIDVGSFGGFISAYMYPRIFVPSNGSGAGLFDGTTYNKALFFDLERPSTIDGHTPRNKKLLTYPYVAAHLSSHRGNDLDFAFEFFSDNGTATFEANGSFGAEGEIIAFPVRYRGDAQFLDGCVSTGSYPLCSWGASGFADALANKYFGQLVACANSLNASLGATLIGGPVAGAFVSKGLSGSYDPLQAPLEATSGMHNSLFSPGVVHGSAQPDAIYGTIMGRGIDAKCRYITREYAEKIDEYFDVFGYATNSVKMPNIMTRPHWNYIKTRGCKLIGDAPAEVLSDICAIFDRGLTFWRKMEEVGHYEYNNEV